MQQYVAVQFGNVKTRLYWSERVASGLNLSHPKVIELLDLILSGKLDNGFLLCCFKDRLCRYGWELFERLCQLRGIQLRFIDELDRKSDTEELQQDLLAVLTSFTARPNGSKTRKLYGVQIDETTASLIFEWRSQKLSTHRIAARLKAEGKHLDCNSREITHTVLYKFLKRHGSVGRKLLRMKAGVETSSATPTGDSLVAFISERVLREEVGPDGKSVFMRFKAFYAEYDAYCDQHGLIAHSRQVVPKHLRDAGFRLRTRRGYLGLYAAIRN